ncbi:MAG: 7TM-DISM domain-containing protein [Chitinophagales bacterium]
MRLLQILFIIFIFSSALKSEVKTFTYDGENVKITGEHIGIIEDSTKQLDFNDIVQENNFITSDQKVPNLMITKSVFWVKINVQNNSKEENLLLMRIKGWISTKKMLI